MAVVFCLGLAAAALEAGAAALVATVLALATLAEAALFPGALVASALVAGTLVAGTLVAVTLVAAVFVVGVADALALGVAFAASDLAPVTCAVLAAAWPDFAADLVLGFSSPKAEAQF